MILSNAYHPPSKNNSFSLIGLCVSYNYFDTLQFMLPVNYLHFEKIYLLTQPDDEKTVEFCKQFQNVVVLFYNFTHHQKVFDKFGALNYAQSIIYRTHPDSWYLILDSDILLPNNFIDVLQKESLRPECIYGVARHNVFKTSELLDKSSVHVSPMPVFQGIPTIIGYFQLYKKKVFHANFHTAEGGDVMFSRNFSMWCRLDNILCYHLGVPGKNWRGKVVSFVDDLQIDVTSIYYNCYSNHKNVHRQRPVFKLPGFRRPK
jgi:hypothetical protein